MVASALVGDTGVMPGPRPVPLGRWQRATEEGEGDGACNRPMMKSKIPMGTCSG